MKLKRKNLLFHNTQWFDEVDNNTKKAINTQGIIEVMKMNKKKLFKYCRHQ